METFYFTYGTDERFPYRHGWTEIMAPDLKSAQELFKMFHPNRKRPDGTEETCLNYSWHYDQERFRQTEMYETQENFGTGCVEHISLGRIMAETPNDADGHDAVPAVENVKLRAMQEVADYMNVYLEFVSRAMTPAEFEAMEPVNGSMTKALVRIVPADAMVTHDVYPIRDARFLVPKDTSLTERNMDALADLAEGRDDYGLANPIYVMKDARDPDRIVVDLSQTQGKKNA